MSIPINFQFKIIKDSEKRITILRKTPSESILHILLKLSAYLIFFEDNLYVETKAHQHYKPDLVQFDSERQWKVTKWIDCGVIDAKKLLKVATHNKNAGIIIVKPNAESAQALKRQADKKLKQSSHIQYLVFSEEHLNQLESMIQNRNEIIILGIIPQLLSLRFNDQNIEIPHTYL